MFPSFITHVHFFTLSGDQESCRHSVDSQGSGGVPRKQMRLDHFTAATQQLDCGFDRHHYPPDSFGSTSSSKTEQVRNLRTKSISQHFFCLFVFDNTHSRILAPSPLQTLYPLSLINGGLDEAKTSLSSSSSAIGRNLTAHQSYTMVTGESGRCPLTPRLILTTHASRPPRNHSLFFLTCHSFQVFTSAHCLFPFPHLDCPPHPTARCHHLRAPTSSAALSETGNVPRSDQHEPLPKHGGFQPGVRRAAGAAEAGFCQ